MTKGKFKVNFIHFKTLVKRYWTLIFNDKLSAVLLFLQAPLMLFLLSLIAQKNSFTEWFKLYSADTLLFVVVMIAAVMGLLNSYREVCKEREIFLREYAAGLDVTAYVLSKVFVLGCIEIVQSLMLVAGSYLIVDFPAPFGFWTPFGYWITVFLVLFSASITGIFISCLLKNSDSAVLPVLFLIIMQVIFAGNIIKLDGALEIVSFVAISRWGLNALGQVFNRNGLFPEHPEMSQSYYETSIFICLAVLIFICILLTVLSILWLKFTCNKFKSKK